MKKVFVLTLAALLLVGGAQAQNKKKAVPAQTLTTSAPAGNTIKNDPGKTNGKTTPKKDMKKIKKEREFIAVRQLDLAAREIGLEMPLIKSLMTRETHRELMPEEIPQELISSLLWSTYGINRPEEGKRVVPSACNSQEFDIYLFDQEGIWLYNAEKHLLGLIAKGDHRADISKQDHFAKAPISLVLVANYDRMEKIKETADREFYAAVDAGYISQDIYLWCASAGFGTVACGAIDRDNLNLLLDITNGKAILAHPVGHVK